MEASPEADGTQPKQVHCTSCGNLWHERDCVELNRKRTPQKCAPMYRCRGCNALESRIQRLKKTCDFPMNWSSKEARAAFFAKHRETFGDDLKTALQLETSETATETARQKLSEEGDWLDEADLRERYANKPDQVTNVLAYARTMLHPVRRVTLYLDTNFRYTGSQETEHAQTQKRTATCTLTEKAAKKNKTEARPAKKTEARPAGKPLSDKQRAALVKGTGKAEASLAKMAEWLQQAEASENSEFVQPAIKIAAQTSAAELAAALAASQVALEPTWQGRAADVSSALSTATSKLQTTLKEVSDFLRLAKGLTMAVTPAVETQAESPQQS